MYIHGFTRWTTHMPRLSCGSHSEKSSRGEWRPFSPTDTVIWTIWSGQLNSVRESEHSWKFWYNIEIRAAIRPGWLPFTPMAHQNCSGLDFIPLSAICVRRLIEETTAQNVVNPKRKNWAAVTTTLSIIRDQSHRTIRDRKGIGDLCFIRQRNRLHVESVQEPDNSSKCGTICVLHGSDSRPMNSLMDCKPMWMEHENLPRDSYHLSEDVNMNLPSRKPKMAFPGGFVAICKVSHPGCSTARSIK
jgi:hypothetical protein